MKGPSWSCFCVHRGLVPLHHKDDYMFTSIYKPFLCVRPRRPDPPLRYDGSGSRHSGAGIGAAEQRRVHFHFIAPLRCEWNIYECAL